MSQDPQDQPLCIVSPAEGRFGEHERQRLQEQLNTGMKGRMFVVDHPVTVTPVIPLTLWVVGQNRDDTGEKWEMQGVFDTEAKAVAACIKPAYWVAPVALNQTLPDETMDGWPGLYFPSEASPS